MTHCAPETVFTPRQAEVSKTMYIHRPTLETAMKNAFKSTQHIVLHGGSGTGKTWLYKKFLADHGITYELANLANASRFGSIAAELKNVIDRYIEPTKTGYTETKQAEVNAVVSKGSLAHEAIYALGAKEPLECCFEFINRKAGGRSAVLVLDNLENVFDDQELLKELADIITLCDDERYARYRVRIMIVGVPPDLKRYYYGTPNCQTVANRLVELPEVSILTAEQCDQLVKKGFGLLGFDLDEEEQFLQHVRYVTLRVPQMVHEYCLEVANIASAAKRVDAAVWQHADSTWTTSKSTYAYSIIESHMNEKETRLGRKNQVLYALSKCEQDEFRTSQIEEIVRREFANSTDGVQLNCNQILSGLARSNGEEAKPLLKKTAKEDAYTFADPRFRMVLRAMMVKSEDGKVNRKPLIELQ